MVRAKHEFNQVEYMANGLFDHTPLLIAYANCPRPKSYFMFCDIWCFDPNFLNIAKEQSQLLPKGKLMQQLLALLK